MARKKETKRAYLLLHNIQEELGGKFQPRTYKKIAVSYGVFNPMICDAFARLQGRFTNENEKQRLIHYFICSSLFDDFTDEKLISDEQFYNISFDPLHYQAQTFDEKAFLKSHLFLKKVVKNLDEYDRVFSELFQAQMDSRNQYDSRLTKEELKRITFEKGGLSVQLCCYYFDGHASLAERTCWYRTGIIIQLTNDLYDIYKDIQDNITTLPNSMTSVTEFEQLYVEQIKEMKNAIIALPYAKNRKQEFSLALAGIFSLGLVAIQQLKSLQDGSGKLPDLKTLPRKALIIDMEKKKNLLSWFKHTYQLARLHQ